MQELINKFPNGQELYNTNSTFNFIIHHINNGMSLYEAISNFAEQNEKQQIFIKELIEKMPMQPIILKEE